MHPPQSAAEPQLTGGITAPNNGTTCLLVFFFFFYITRLIPWNACALPPRTSSREEEQLNSSEILNARADAPPAKRVCNDKTTKVSSHFIFTVALCERARRAQRAQRAESALTPVAEEAQTGPDRVRQSRAPLFLLQPRTALPHPVPVLKEIAAGLLPPPRLRERLQMSAALCAPVHQQPRRDHFLPTKKKFRLP